MTDKPPRMIFSLSEAEREALERLRKQRGLRSHAEVLRELIRQAASSGLPTPERQSEIKRHIAARRGERASDGVAEPKAEGAAFKSRLKGEWKAP